MAQDIKEATRHVARAAELGHAPAQIELGLCSIECAHNCEPAPERLMRE